MPDTAINHRWRKCNALAHTRTHTQAHKYSYTCIYVYHKTSPSCHSHAFQQSVVRYLLLCILMIPPLFIYPFRLTYSYVYVCMCVMYACRFISLPSINHSLGILHFYAHLIWITPFTYPPTHLTNSTTHTPTHTLQTGWEFNQPCNIYSLVQNTRFIVLQYQN